MIRHISDVNKEVRDRINLNQQLKEGEISGIPTGFKDIDRFSYGLQKTDLVVVGAETSQGKTAFCVDVAFNIAKKGYPVLFVTLEMSGMQLVGRMLSKESKISSKDILMRKLKDSEVAQTGRAMESVKDIPLYIEDRIETNFKTMFKKIYEYVQQYSIETVVIDYLQLMKNDDTKASTSDKFAEVANYSKRFSKATDIPVLLVSQLKRADNAKDPRPTISRLKQSGDIENAADIIILIWRPEEYGQRDIEVNGVVGSSEGKAHVIFAKGRNIGTSQFLMGFDKETTTFYDLDDDLEDSMDEDNNDDLPF